MRALSDAVARSVEGEAMSVGRDGASDAISFLEAGIPAVEFGPVGGGHHGPDEWVSIASLARYRQRARRLRARRCPPRRLAREAATPREARRSSDRGRRSRERAGSREAPAPGRGGLWKRFLLGGAS